MLTVESWPTLVVADPLMTILACCDFTESAWAELTVRDAPTETVDAPPTVIAALPPTEVEYELPTVTTAAPPTVSAAAPRR
jgi:hypothetical protein